MLVDAENCVGCGFCVRDCPVEGVRIVGKKARIDPLRCTHCHRCTRDCPMSLPVEAMVTDARMDNRECILCGQCADSCPREAIRLSFGES